MGNKLSAHRKGRISLTRPVNVGAARSYIQDLPPDLLGAIFELCLANSSSPPTTALPNPYTVCAVCRYWREIAFNTSRLWSTLCVSWGIENGFEDLRRMRSRADRWGSYALRSTQSQNGRSICFYEPSYSERGIRVKPPGFHEAIVEWLMRARTDITLHLNLRLAASCEDIWKVLRQRYHAPIRTLHLEAHHTRLRVLLADDTDGFEALETVEHLIIQLPLVPPIHYTVGFIHPLHVLWKEYVNISSFTNLKHLSLVNVCPSGSVIHSQISLIQGIPYAQLTGLDISEIQLPRGQIRSVLRSCVNLKTCSIGYLSRCPYATDDEVDSNLPIKLTHLQSFAIKFTHEFMYFTAPDFFNGIETPALVNLSLYYVILGHAIQDDIRTMLRGSENTLKKVLLHDFLFPGLDKDLQEFVLGQIFPATASVITSASLSERERQTLFHPIILNTHRTVECCLRYPDGCGS